MNKVLVCESDELKESECFTFQFTGREYFAVRHQGSVFAYLNRCPHIGAPLQFARNQFLTRDKSLILCAMHGALFQIDDGECIGGPCPGEALEKIPVYEEKGSIYMEIADSAS